MMLPKDRQIHAMVNEHVLTVSLEEFGLSKYEAQAYVTLISRGTVSASDLAYYSGVPRTKIYPTLLKLAKKNLVVTSKSKPISCTAVAPEDAFDPIIHEQINKVNAMNTLISSLKKASEESRRNSGSEERRYFHISANSVPVQLQTMIDGSKISIRVMADQWGLGLLAECREQLASALRRGLEIKMIIPPAQICSEPFRRIPWGVDIRGSEIMQNCFVFDETELLMINSNDGRGAVFSSTDILGVNQEKVFSNVWRHAVRTRALADMSSAEAQEICRIIRMIDEDGLSHILGSAMISKKPEYDMLRLLEKNGISLKSRSLEDFMEMMDAVIQITCSGRASLESGTRNITVESSVNGGHLLPWISMIDGFLQRHGYSTRTIYQKAAGSGERIHIKISR